MSDIRYTTEHEWVRLDGDVAVIGISDHAQSQLGDVVYVELPEIGRKVARGEQAAVVESVKAASEVYAPISGEVVAVNDDLVTTPGLVNQGATSEGWFLKLKPSDPGEISALMDTPSYEKFLAGLT